MIEVFDCPTVLRASRDVDTGTFRDEGFHCVCEGVLLLDRRQMSVSIIEKEDFDEKAVSWSSIRLAIALTSVSRVNFRVLRSSRRNCTAGRIRLIVVVNSARGEEQITLKLPIIEFNRFQEVISTLFAE
jgi:hypothetical protein